MDADISGKDVPIAIIVRPMNVSGTLNSEAILTEEFTTALADIINITVSYTHLTLPTSVTV